MFIMMQQTMQTLVNKLTVVEMISESLHNNNKSNKSKITNNQQSSSNQNASIE